MAAACADRIAIREAGIDTSYDALNRQANRIAHRLLEEDGVDVAPVAVLADGFLQTVAAVHGVWKANCRLLLLDRFQPPARLALILAHADARIILASGQAIPLASSFDGLVVDLDRVETRCDGNPDSVETADTISSIIYTSGSTGRPKGVIHNHSTLLHVADYWIEQFGLDFHDRALFVGNPGHVAALGDIVRFTVAGMTTFPFRVQESNLRHLVQSIAAEQITVMHAVPSIFRAMCNNLDPSSDISSIRLMQVGGEPLLRSDVAGFKRHFSKSCQLVNNLGSTEAPATMQYVVDPDREFEDAIVPVGRPGPGKRIRLVDEKGDDVVDGEIGDVLIEGSVISRGYYKDSELTARFFSGDLEGPGLRQFRSGDLGRRDADGLITVLGRADDRIKVRGYRVEPAEIEAALREIVEGSQVVTDLAVITVGGDMDVRLVAYLGIHPDSSLDLEEVRVALSGRLPQVMHPDEFVILERLPRTATGKIDRQALPSCTAIGASGAPVKQHGSCISEELASLWSQLLGGCDPADDDDFFALGGDSLKALELIHCIEQIFGQTVTLPELMQDSTLGALTLRIESGRGVVPQPLLIQLTSGTGTPLHLVHGMGGGVVVFRELARQLVPRPVFAYQARGLDGISKPLDCIEEMASAYLVELRRVQPEGPYLLAGYSMGGIVAFDMARQLRQQGEEIAALIPIDSLAPLPRGVVVRWHMRKLLSRLHLNYLVGRDSSVQHRNAFIRGLNRLMRSHMLALRRYRPHVYGSSIDLILSFELNQDPPPWNPNEPLDLLQERKRRRWRRIVGGQLRVHWVEGGHLSLFKGDPLGRLVEQLQHIISVTDRPRTVEDI